MADDRRNPRSRDPRSEAEKARAALMRNDAMGIAVTQSPIERQPSVTPQTFGDDSEQAWLRSGVDQGVEAGGPPPRAGGEEQSSSIVEAEQIAVDRDDTVPVRPEGQ